MSHDFRIAGAVLENFPSLSMPYFIYIRDHGGWTTLLQMTRNRWITSTMKIIYSFKEPPSRGSIGDLPALRLNTGRFRTPRPPSRSGTATRTCLERQSPPRSRGFGPGCEGPLHPPGGRALPGRPLSAGGGPHGPCFRWHRRRALALSTSSSSRRISGIGRPTGAPPGGAIPGAGNENYWNYGWLLQRNLAGERSFAAEVNAQGPTQVAGKGMCTLGVGTTPTFTEHAGLVFNLGRILHGAVGWEAYLGLKTAF